MPSSKAFGVESCTVSSSLPIPTRSKQDMQPSLPLGVFSSTPLQVGQVEISGGAGFICSGVVAATACGSRTLHRLNQDTRSCAPDIFRTDLRCRARIAVL